MTKECFAPLKKHTKHSKTYFEHKFALRINVQNPEGKKFDGYYEMNVEALFFTRRAAEAAKMTT